MTKIKIDSPGISVEVEADEALETVADKALSLFREAGGWPADRPGSVGFTTSERRDTTPVQPSTMTAAPGPYPVQIP